MVEMLVIDFTGAPPLQIGQGIPPAKHAHAILPPGMKTPKGFKKNQFMVLPDAPEQAFMDDIHLQDRLEHWVQLSEDIHLYGDGYGAFLVALASFYRQKNLVFIPPEEPGQGTYLPYIAAIAQGTWMPGAQTNDPRFALLKGKHLNKRVHRKGPPTLV